MKLPFSPSQELKTSVPQSAVPGTSSPERLMDIINFTQKVAADIHGTFEEEAVFRKLKEQFEADPKYNMSVLYLSEDRTFLYNKVFTAKATFSDIKYLGQILQSSEDRYKIFLDRTPTYSRVVLNGETVYHRTKDLMKELFPPLAVPLIVKLFNYEKEYGVITPITVDGKIIGTFGMTAEAFSPDMKKAVENLGYHISSALDTAGHYREIRRREEELREAKERAEAADRLKSTFLASMSHELRTPLNAVLGFVEIVLSNGSLDPENTKYLELAKNSGNSLLQLIKDVLDFSKINADLYHMEKTSFSLEPVLENIASVAEGFYAKEGKGIALRKKVPKLSGILMEGEPNRLEQVLTNLLSNALKFTHSGYVEYGIRFESPRSSKKLTFYVKDTGIGIAEEQLDRIFKPFRQAEEKITRKYGGTGLGLAISEKIVELMGGRLAVESVPGKGSTFSFTLPYRKGRLQDKKTAVSSAHVKTDKPKTLIVDDNAINRLMLKTLLKKEGFPVSVAENGNEAIRIYKEDPSIGLILMDMYMPEMDGAEATKQIREMEANYDGSRPCIIAVTAAGTIGEKQMMLDAGCDAYISKPVQIDKLLSILSNFLGTS